MDQKLHLSPERRLIMTLSLRKSQEILQMNQQELAQYLEAQIEKNPLFELDPPRYKKRVDFDIAAKPTLHEYLLAQIRENFPCPLDQIIAKEFLEHLDEKGFLTKVPENQERILSILQTFDPPGIFARSLQEALLLQLKAKGKGQSQIFTLIESHFDDLLKSRFSFIKKKFKTEDLSSTLHELVSLTTRPASSFSTPSACPIYPDLRITKIEGGWAVGLIEDEFPHFHLKTEYLALKPTSLEEKASMREFKVEADCLIRALSRRKKLLLEIGKLLVCKQNRFLEQKGPLIPFNAKALAEKLSIHESTLSRALNSKYVSTPLGILSLKSLLSISPEKTGILQALQELIQSEDKKNPYSDEALAKHLAVQGFKVARRTIVKYRKHLKIGPASQRNLLG